MMKTTAGRVVGHARSFGKVQFYLSRKDQPLKLHIGCGRNYKESWINIDFDPATRKDILHDLSKGIPFPDNSVDFIYNEHFIEHLSYKDGFAFMNEAYRVLKPGGVLRIACPDLDFMIEGYTKDNWRSQEWVGLINAHWYPSKGYAFNQNLREDGEHRYMYNYDDLAARLNEAGFFSHHIHAKKMGHSTYPELQNIERRADSLVVEARKDRSFAQSPLLTVVVLSRNNETTIVKTLDSILAQKADFKFIIKVAEDGSKDRTQQVLLEYQEKHPDVIRLMMNGRSLGAEKALHRVLKTIDTEYFAFIEGGDCWTDTGKLQMQIDALRENPQAAVSTHLTSLKDGPSKDHPSSLVCRNVLDLPSIPFYMARKEDLYSLYSSAGNSLFIDKAMAEHNAAEPVSLFSKPRLKSAAYSVMSSYRKRKRKAGS